MVYNIYDMSSLVGVVKKCRVAHNIYDMSSSVEVVKKCRVVHHRYMSSSGGGPARADRGTVTVSTVLAGTGPDRPSRTVLLQWNKTYFYVLLSGTTFLKLSQNSESALSFKSALKTYLFQLYN